MVWVTALFELDRLWRWMTLPGWRIVMVEHAIQRARARVPYQWGGGHHGPSWGLDCSGLIIVCARAAGIDLDGWDSIAMRELLAEVHDPLPGDLAVYAPRHVSMVIGGDAKKARVVGAEGGGPWCVTEAIARDRGARVRTDETHLHRPGFVGFRTIEGIDRDLMGWVAQSAEGQDRNG